MRLYDTYRWKKARLRFLAENPLCVMCAEVGRTTIAYVVDHIVPHKGSETLFWDVWNWQPLCRTCHDSLKKATEMSGTIRGCDVNGIPLDPEHPWRKGR